MPGQRTDEASKTLPMKKRAQAIRSHLKTRADRLSIRNLRLVTGLILFTYVTTHLLNHSLGNTSVATMESGLLVQKWIWQGVVGTAALYLALSTHFTLGLWAFYERRHFGWTPTEIVQLGLGLSIPFLLMNHLFATRIALTQYGLQKGYAQELYSFWVAAPELGLLQVSVLIVAWIHGCIGVYLWLRLKRFLRRSQADAAVRRDHPADARPAGLLPGRPNGAGAGARSGLAAGQPGTLAGRPAGGERNAPAGA